MIEVVEKENYDFPLLMISNYDGSIFLIDGSRDSDDGKYFSGTCLQSNSTFQSIGDYKIIWSARILKPYTGEITLRNK